MPAEARLASRVRAFAPALPLPPKAGGESHFFQFACGQKFAEVTCSQFVGDDRCDCATDSTDS
eukprot:6686416-Pyramimonas_sp.AAC.1